jgi:hypothetical protein
MGLLVNVICFIVCVVLVLNNIGREVIAGIYATFIAFDIISLNTNSTTPKQHIKINIVLDVLMLTLIIILYGFNY